MDYFHEEWPFVLWMLDRVVGSAVFCGVVVCVRRCWKQARENQRLALGDGVDHRASERRSLLVTVHRDRR